MGGYVGAVKEIDWDAVAEAEIAMSEMKKTEKSAVTAALRLTRDTEEE